MGVVAFGDQPEEARALLWAQPVDKRQDVICGERFGHDDGVYHQWLGPTRAAPRGLLARTASPSDAD